jgi:circadian clock protein KaiB
LGLIAVRRLPSAPATKTTGRAMSNGRAASVGRIQIQSASDAYPAHCGPEADASLFILNCDAEIEAAQVSPVAQMSIDDIGEPDDAHSDDLLERAVAETAGAMVLRLYVAGSSPNSIAALQNLRALASSLPGHAVEIVDVFKNPRRAAEDSVLVTPMLIKVGPGAVCRVVGTLNDDRQVLRGLGVRGDKL